MSVLPLPVLPSPKSHANDTLVPVVNVAVKNVALPIFVGLLLFAVRPEIASSSTVVLTVFDELFEVSVSILVVVTVALLLMLG